MQKNQHLRLRVTGLVRDEIEVASRAERRSISNWICNVIEDRLATLRPHMPELQRLRDQVATSSPPSKEPTKP